MLIESLKPIIVHAIKYEDLLWSNMFHAGVEFKNLFPQEQQKYEDKAYIPYDYMLELNNGFAIES